MRTLTIPSRLSTHPLTSLRTAWPRIVGAFESPLLAYATLLAFQLKVIWGLWLYRDVPDGDTASYFTFAWRWYASGKVNIAWSPLYTAFYGSFLFLNPDPVWATFAHRVVIVLVASGLVLAVFRRLLPPAIAWLCAAWWAALPIVFNTMYEVHLFAVIPVLVVWLLLLTATGPWWRASALAILGVSVVLVRNELSVPFGLMALILAVIEWRRMRRGEGPRIGRTILRYATTLGIAVAVCGAAYANSYVKYPVLADILKGKHTVNMAQVYAVGYQQRHPEWSLNPWLDCYGLMQNKFGSPEPTLREMIASNPRAVLEHFAWNLSLTPSGLQLLLFNCVAGTVSPDYSFDVLQRMDSSLAVLLTTLLLLVWGIGFVCLWRNRREWWRDTLYPHALGWAGMFAVAGVVPLIIMTQRPRPSYLFAFAVLLMVITGLCFHAATNRWRLADRLRGAMPLLTVGFVLLTPGFFSQAVPGQEREIANAVQRLMVHRLEVTMPGQTLAVPSHSIGSYANPRIPFNESKLPSVRPRVFLGQMYAIPLLLNQRRPEETFPAVLERFAVDYVYLDELTVSRVEKFDPAGAFIIGCDAPGWKLIASGNDLDDRWRLYRRER